MKCRCGSPSPNPHKIFRNIKGNKSLPPKSFERNTYIGDKTPSFKDIYDIFHVIKEASEDENFDSTQCLGYCNALEISDCSELLGSYRAAIAPETKHFSNNVEWVFELFQT